MGSVEVVDGCGGSSGKEYMCWDMVVMGTCYSLYIRPQQVGSTSVCCAWGMSPAESFLSTHQEGIS